MGASYKKSYGSTYWLTYLWEIAVRWEEHIFRLQVAMNDVFGMQMLQGHEDLGNQETSDSLRQSTHFTRQNHLKHVACNGKESILMAARF